MKIEVTKMFVPERDELLAENERLRAENERLHVQVMETARECGIQKTENERLRAALEQINEMAKRERTHPHEIRKAITAALGRSNGA